MTPSQACIDLIMRSEGCVLTAYEDAAGVWTIGWGHAGSDVYLGSLKWSQEQADAALQRDLGRASGAVERMVKVPLTQGQFDALVDFTFNLGAGRLASSTLLKCLNAGRYDDACEHLLRWDHAGHVELTGLKARREAEAEMWRTP